jgi:hypothetical protein
VFSKDMTPLRFTFFHSGPFLSLLLLALPSLSCSVLIERDREQCATDADCQKHGSAFPFCIDSVCTPDPTWSCIGSVVWPRPPAGMATVTLVMQDLVLEKPITDVTARLCRKLDVTCSQPIAEGIRADAAGNLVVHVETGFDGYAELVSPKKITGLYFFYPPVDGDRVVPYVPLIDEPTLGTLAVVAGGTVDSGRGHAFLGAYDCLHRPAEGVSFRSENADDKTVVFYVIKKIPSIMDTATDSSGHGGIINLPPGTITLAGEIAGGKSIGTESLFVRAGQITYTSVLPSPE